MPRLSEHSLSGQLDSSNWPIFQQVYLPSIRDFDRPYSTPGDPIHAAGRVEFNKNVYHKPDEVGSLSKDEKENKMDLSYFFFYRKIIDTFQIDWCVIKFYANFSFFFLFRIISFDFLDLFPLLIEGKLRYMIQIFCICDW